MANPAYKHLEGKTVVGHFTLAQWAQLLAGVVLGLVFGIYLSPLPPTVTVFISCLLPGLPLAAGYGAMGLEFSLAQLARAVWRFWRAPSRWLPGPGVPTAGYLVVPDPDPDKRSAGRPEPARAPRLEGLWDV